jgi:hypothetical protein
LFQRSFCWYPLSCCSKMHLSISGHYSCPLNPKILVKFTYYHHLGN